MREPTNDEQRLMKIGGFDILEAYLEWMNTPLDQETIDKLEEPDWEEIAIEESGIFEDEE
jgi:hypothetical protein